MNTEKLKSPMWVKVNKGEEFPEDVFFATKESLENGRIPSNMVHGKGCKAPENGYCLAYESITKIPIEK